MAGLASSIYNSIFRQNTIFLGTVFTGAFAFEIAFDTISDSIWNTLNKGRQWQDIRARYIQNDE